MFKIATLNKISPVGLKHLTDAYTLVDTPEEANGILVRSQDMKEMEFSKDLLAIARAGAGTNNIPIDRCSQQGIVVFNTPGANANSVKELVIAGILIAARNLSSAVAWAKTLTEDVSKTVEKNKSQFAGHEIKGMTLGVIGLGAIGAMVANAANALVKMGAKEVYACASHAVLSGPAIQRIQDSAIKELILLNTIQLPEEKKIEKIRMLSVAPIFAEAMRRVFSNESISTIFE